jgi:hypothetical protein
MRPDEKQALSPSLEHPLVGFAPVGRQSHCKIETKPPDEGVHKLTGARTFTGTLQRGRFDP